METTFTDSILTLNVRGPSYLVLNRSISWMLMPWIDFKYMCLSMWNNDTKCKYMFMYPVQNLARKELTVLDVTNRTCQHEQQIQSKWSPPLFCLFIFHCPLTSTHLSMAKYWVFIPVISGISTWLVLNKTYSETSPEIITYCLLSYALLTIC